jgi:uncharacterized integral membrane protein
VKLRNVIFHHWPILLPAFPKPSISCVLVANTWAALVIACPFFVGQENPFPQSIFQKILLLRLHSILKKKYYGRQALLQKREGENMKNPKVIVGLVVGVLFVIFLFQNMDEVALRLYFWQVSMPKIILVPLAILVGFAAGFVVAKITGRPRKPKPEKDLQAPSPLGSRPPDPGK